MGSSVEAANSGGWPSRHSIIMLAALAVFICYMARVIFWSLFTMLTPVAAAGGLTALLVTRVFMGIGEGIIFPSIYAMFGRWVPETERSRGIGTLFSTFPLGSVLLFWQPRGSSCITAGK